jgi:membrane protease YdiL (CAAX protease family)
VSPIRGSDTPHRRERTRNDWIASISTLSVGLATILFLCRYNGQPYSFWSNPSAPSFRVWEEYLLVNTGLLLFPPFLLIFGGLRESASEYGFQPPIAKSSRIGYLFFVVMVPVMLIASRSPQFYHYYPIQPQAGHSWSYLLYYEISYGFYMFAWEFFFRGFLTFGLARAFGSPAAVVLQAVGFGVMHMGKPALEMISSFPGGLILGWLALRCRSFLPCFALHWAISLSFDLLAIYAKPGGIF